jgi:hypothetical protein
MRRGRHRVFDKNRQSNFEIKFGNFRYADADIVYRGRVGGQIGCGTGKKNAFAVVVYRPFANADKSKSAGEILSIEFVPEKFKLF